MMQIQHNKFSDNARWFSPRVRLWAFATLAVLAVYGGIFYAIKTFGANKAFAFSRPALIEMDEAALQKYREDIKALLIKEPEQIRMLLGQDLLLVMAEPDMQRQDAMMTMWQYSSDDCVLDIYFKPAENQDFAPVMHHEIRARKTAYFVNMDEEQSTETNEQHCLESLLSQEIVPDINAPESL